MRKGSVFSGQKNLESTDRRKIRESEINRAHGVTGASEAAMVPTAAKTLPGGTYHRMAGFPLRD